MKTIAVIGAAALLALATPAYGAAVQPASATTGWQQRDPADSLYKAGRQAINDEDYTTAARLFAQLVDRYPRSDYAGDALYWRAWSLYRLAQQGGSRRFLDDARASLDRQQKDYPKAATVADGKDLRARILSALASRGDADAAQQIAQKANELETAKGCPSEEDDMRLAALQGLMQMDAENAVPILKQVLARRDACSEPLRRRAVMLLAMKHSPDVVNVMLGVARTDPSNDVRGQAIMWLGQARSDAAQAALDSIVFSTKDSELQRRALMALMMQRNERSLATLRRAVQDESLDEDVRTQAIFWLGQAQRPEDVQFLRQVFAKTTNTDMRSRIIQAIAQSGGPESTKWLLDIARDKSVSEDSRKNAIFWMAQHGASVDDVITLYDQLRGEPELQRQALFSLAQRKDAAATDKLMSIARNDPDREMRKQAVFWLGQKKDPKVVQFLMDLISK